MASTPSDNWAAKDCQYESALAPEDAVADESTTSRPGRIFVAGLPIDIAYEAFRENFEKYGELMECVILKHLNCGFVSFADNSVIDTVIQENHVFGGETVVIKRSMPAAGKTNRIFISGIPTGTTDDDLKNYFAKFGKIKKHKIVLHGTSDSMGYAYIKFAKEKAVDDLLANGNKIEFPGAQVETEKDGAKKASNGGVEIKRRIPKLKVASPAFSSKDFKTKEIFVGRIPAGTTDDEFKNFFADFGEIKQHKIMRDNATGRSRRFGFVTFATEEAVDELLAKRNKIKFPNAKLVIEKAKPKKASKSLPMPDLGDNRPAFGGGHRGAYGGAGYGADPNTPDAGFMNWAYGGYTGSMYDGGYASFGPYRGGSSFEYAGGYGQKYETGGFDRPAEVYGGHGAYYSDAGSGYGGGDGYRGRGGSGAYDSSSAGRGGSGAYGGRGGSGAYDSSSAGRGGSGAYGGRGGSGYYASRGSSGAYDNNNDSGGYGGRSGSYGNSRGRFHPYTR